jgi:hypothetical protein
MCAWDSKHIRDAGGCMSRWMQLIRKFGAFYGRCLQAQMMMMMGSASSLSVIAIARGKSCAKGETRARILSHRGRGRSNVFIPHHPHTMCLEYASASIHPRGLTYRYMHIDVRIHACMHASTGMHTQLVGLMHRLEILHDNFHVTIPTIPLAMSML